MGDMGDAMAATSDYATNARAAANALGEVKDAYSSALSSAQGLATTLDGMKEISSTTTEVKGQMDSLAKNLSSLAKTNDWLTFTLGKWASLGFLIANTSFAL